VSFVLYGSFNRPYSFLASLRADRLAAAEGRFVEWRAVVHDPAVPVNTAAAIAGYPALHGPQANRQHAALPGGFWAGG